MPNIQRAESIKTAFLSNQNPMSTYDNIMKINAYGRTATLLPEHLKKFDIPLYRLYGYTTPESMSKAISSYIGYNTKKL